MKKRLTCLFLLTTFSVLHSIEAAAQYKLQHGVFGCGGAVRGGGYRVYDTVCQTAISVLSGGSHRVKSGFWYMAEISSAVDVVITFFSCEYRDDAVLLRWTICESAHLKGLNIYRAEGEREEDLAQINTEPIEGDGGNEYIDSSVIPGRTYTYQIGALDGEDSEWRSPTISISLPPKPLTLYQNFPNPFNPQTNISFFLPAPQHVTLTIYDIRGSKVRILADETREAGNHKLTWNGKNDLGNTVGSGVYYYRLKAGKRIVTKKMIVLR